MRSALEHPLRDGLATLAMLGAIIALGAFEVAGLSLTGTALLLTLPVLFAASRGDALYGAIVAILASAVFNFFLLPPRFTFHIDGAIYLVTFLVFVVVALVTGVTTSGLRLREREAAAQAAQSDLESAFLAEMALAASREDLDARALAFLAGHFGPPRLFRAEDLQAGTTGLAPLDASAAVWALEHEAVTGHASAIMPAADFRFFAFGRAAHDVLALPVAGPQDIAEGAFLARLARAWGQARDHLDMLAQRQRGEEAEARERTRRALLSALGHDFRTPLTVLKEGLARMEGAQAAELGEEVERLRRLGEDLLASARLDAGLALACEPVDLVDIFGELERQFPPARRKVALAMELAADLPLVRAEPVMLLHLLGNVLDNGLRHAAARLTVSARATGGGVAVRVADDGPGIPGALATSVFEPFVSGGHDARAARGGSGLGLAIARDLAEAMGARLSLESSGAGEGAVFVLRLPAMAMRGDGA